MGAWTFAETEAYRRRAEVTARLADLENAVAADEAKAVAEKAARAERQAADFAEIAARVQATLKTATPRAAAAPTATRKVDALPVVRVDLTPGRVERRELAWWFPGGGER